MIRFFASHPTAANLLMAAFLALGLAAAPSVKRETFPNIPPTDVEVRVVYPGATALEVEAAICQRIEDVVDGIEALEETRCDSREGVAIATLEMREGGNFDRFLDDIKSDVEAISTFPADVETPVIRQLGRTDFVAAVAVSGPMSAPHLKAYAEALKDRLLRLPGVSRVTVQGFSDHQIRIEIPATTLRQYGLSVDGLARVVAAQSVDLPGGVIETTDSTVLVRFADERRSPREFENLVVVGGKAGAEIRLGDIATITDRFENDETRILLNGQRGALLELEKARGDDTLDVVDSVRSFLAREKAMAPPGITMELTQDVSSIVRDRLNMLLRNGAQGLVLVFLVMWAFFSFRYSFWVTMGLPVSFLGAIAGMALLGYSFDMITMVGLLIAVGLLMDDAIVLSENIAAHRLQGKPPIEAAVEGARQVAPGVVSSFLTTVAMFGALAFMQGHMGAVLKVMPVVLAMTLLVSLIEAFFILPHHLMGALHAGTRESPSAIRRRIDAGVEWVRENIVGGLVDRAVTWRYLTLGLVLLAFLLAVTALAGGFLKFRAFPDLDGDVVEARILLPQGTPLARTEHVVERVLAALDTLDREARPNQPDGQALVRNVLVLYDRNSDAYESGPHVATISVDLLGSETRNARLDDVLDRWRELVGPVPDVLALKFTERAIGPGGRPIDIRLEGDDLEQLKAASMDLQAWLRSYRGVHDLSDDLRPGKPEVRIRLRQGATMLGLSAADIAGQLRSAFQGRVADEVQMGAESYEIDIRLRASDRDSLADLDDFTITAEGGQQVPLKVVASLEQGRGYGRINRVDGRRTVTIQAELDTTISNAAELVADTRARFLAGFQQRHPGVVVDFQGQAKESSKTGSSLQRNFLIGLLGIFLILSYQFRSYVEPIVVMVIIPLALIGVVAGHLLLGMELSMPSMVGAASLAGVVVNDSILLVRFIKLRRTQGMTVAMAARRASRQRFRAILLTSLTTVAGLLPILTERSLQAQVLAPLVISLAFGLAVTTILVLLVVPAFYTVLDDLGLTAQVEQPEPNSPPPNPLDID